MHSVRRAALAGSALALAACQAGPPAADLGSTGRDPAPITRLDGELHLHQFPLGSHAWVAFVKNPVDASSVNSDQLVELTSVPTKVTGPCTLWVSPVCRPACAASSFCTDANVCTPFAEIKYIDGGEIDVTGSALVPRIRMRYDPTAMSYRSDPPPGDTQIFRGGEQLRIAGGTGDFALAASIPAPLPVVVRAPDLTHDLHLPRDAALDIKWDGEGAEQIVISIGASAGEDRSARIRCVTADIGTLTVPRDFMAALPPPPRDTRIEVERDEERILPTAQPGVGVLAHAAQTTWENGSDL